MADDSRIDQELRLRLRQGKGGKSSTSAPIRDATRSEALNSKLAVSILSQDQAETGRDLLKNANTGPHLFRTEAVIKAIAKTLANPRQKKSAG